MKTLNEFMREKYLDFVNNYLTVDVFAEHNEISPEQAGDLLEMGRVLHEEYCELMKGSKA